ncbi:hypothetical protein [Paenibacillus sp. B01]|uniref:hypothetical protein n=1 Tax=Paenibacillus sp. B01 TaxID=2660554 RepID=UPI00129A430C|nr:hypothetical protein [Paenibacillus sp. B01]QGG54468.1 hypothetical protein GE073_01860 [Paenibacillus sp. B01]
MKRAAAWLLPLLIFAAGSAAAAWLLIGPPASGDGWAAIGKAAPDEAASARKRAVLAAYAGLTPEESRLLPASPKDSAVLAMTAGPELAQRIGAEHEGRTVHAVRFRVIGPGDAGTLTVYLSQDGKTVLGKERAR